MPADRAGDPAGAALAVMPEPALAALQPIAERAREYARAARAPTTLAAYSRQLAAFSTWCAAHGLPALPAAGSTVAWYLTARADGGWSVATMAQALSAISQAHAQIGEPSPRVSPEVRETWAGVKRTRGVAQRKAAPLLPDQLRAISRALPTTLLGTRDRAVLLVSFAGALRRIELVLLEVADVCEDPDGLVVAIRRSKTDQEGKGESVGVPYGSDPLTCPVRAVRAWLEASGISEGAIFRGVRNGRLTEKRLHGRDVARIVQRSAERAGIDSAGLSGHSPRSGLATAAAKARKPLHVIQKQMRHKSLAQTLTYVRDADLFDENAASGIGL